MDMTYAEAAAEILANIGKDGPLSVDFVEAVEVAMRALEDVEAQAQIIVNLNRDLKNMRKAMNGQSEYAYLGGDLISRAALIERIENVNWYSVNNKGVLHTGAADEESAYMRYSDIVGVVSGALAVEAEPVVHAHWVKMAPDQRPFFSPNYTHVCSKCGNGGYKHYKRCYECGTIMDEKVFEPTPLGRLCLGGRVTKRLKQMGVTTVEQLEAMDKHTLYNTPGLGKKSILEIESELRIWHNEKENKDGDRI